MEATVSVVKAEERFQGGESTFRRNVYTFLLSYTASHVGRHLCGNYGHIDTIFFLTVELGIVSDHVMLCYVILCME